MVIICRFDGGYGGSGLGDWGSDEEFSNKEVGVFFGF